MNRRLSSPNPRPFTIKRGLIPILALAMILVGYLSLMARYQAPVFQKGDDWTRYRKHAVDIIDNGIWIPSENGAYSTPAGFLYNYYMAVVYAATDYNDRALVQNQFLLLCLSIGCFYYAFRRTDAYWWNLFLFLTLSHFAYYDFLYYYTGMVLSENLVIFFLGLFFLLFRYGFEGNKPLLRALAFFSLGLVYLTRPNYFPFLVAFSAWYLYQTLFRKNVPWKWGLIDLAILVATINFMGLRNYVVVGEWSVLPAIQWQSAAADHWPYPAYVIDEPVKYIASLLKRSLLPLGYTPAFVPWISIRFHWIIMWIGILAGLFYRLNKRKALTAMEQMIGLHLITVIGPIVAVAYMTRYGIIFLAPGIIPGVGLLFSLFQRSEVSGKASNSGAFSKR